MDERVLCTAGDEAQPCPDNAPISAPTSGWNESDPPPNRGVQHQPHHPSQPDMGGLGDCASLKDPSSFPTYAQPKAYRASSWIY